MRLVIVILSIFLATQTLASDSLSSVRVGFASVVLSSNQTYLPTWKKYLETKIGRSVEFRFLNSCQKAMSLLQTGRIDFAWIGGYCYVKNMSLGYLKLITVPVYRGEPHHRSFIIVHRDSSLTDFSDLRGRIFAFSEPDSNTGFAYPITLLPKSDGQAKSYFRQTFFTFNHVDTIQAVVDQVADGGAVNSYIWEYLASLQPEVTKKTRIISTSPKFGFSPVISRSEIQGDIAEMMKNALEDMRRDPAGKNLLAKLKLDEFRQFPPSLFNSTRQIVNKLRRRGSWTAAVTID